jgi:hypothetical protein
MDENRPGYHYYADEVEIWCNIGNVVAQEEFGSKSTEILRILCQSLEFFMLPDWGVSCLTVTGILAT